MEFEPLSDFLMLESPEKLDEKYDGCKILRPLNSFMAFLDARTKNVMDDELLQKTYSKIEEQKNLKADVSVTNFKNFDNFTEQLDSMIETNSKNFDSLWKDSTNITDNFRAISININNMANTLANSVEANAKFYNLISKTEGSSMSDPWKNIQEGFAHWGKYMGEFASNIDKHITEFFHYHKNELKSLRELDYLRRYALQNYKDSKKVLATEKASLFHSKDLTKWECRKQDVKEDLDVVFGDMKIAFKYILPEKTSKLAHKKEIVEYLAYHQLAESLMAIADNNKNTLANFFKFGENIRTLFDEPKSLWSLTDETCNESNVQEKELANKDATWVQEGITQSIINMKL